MIITAPEPLNYINSTNHTIKSKIFLAGSIEMGSADDWQDDMGRFFSSRGYRVYNPRRKKWDSTLEQTIENAEFFRQVTWELDALDICTDVFVYLQGGTRSPITLLEIGLIVGTGKNITIVCDTDYWRRGNVEVICERYNVPLFNSLKDYLNCNETC